MGQSYDLQERLVDFAVRVIRLCESLPTTLTGNHISRQLLRSGTSPAPNHSEAQGAESRADFIHKLRIALKELRETKTWLQIILRSRIVQSPDMLTPLLEESDQLIAIFVTSIKTTRANMKANSPTKGVASK